jgi:hypothetical protein
MTTPIYTARSNANRVAITNGNTLGQLLTANGMAGKLDEFALYNWGTRDPAAINRALFELVGCRTLARDPVNSVLDASRG